MRTIKATLEPDADGTLHLPLPPELRKGRLRVTATIELAEPTAKIETNLKGFGALRGKIGIAPDFDEPLEDFKEYME